jgi:hypothetical protein
MDNKHNITQKTFDDFVREKMKSTPHLLFSPVNYANHYQHIFILVTDREPGFLMCCREGKYSFPRFEMGPIQLSERFGLKLENILHLDSEKNKVRYCIAKLKEYPREPISGVNVHGPITPLVFENFAFGQYKQFFKEIYAPFLASSYNPVTLSEEIRTPDYSDIPAAIPARLFFEYIVGMDEETFRKKYGFTDDPASYNRKVNDILGIDTKDWVDEYPRRRHIFMGKSVFVGKSTFGSQLPDFSPSSRARHLTILFYDPFKPENTEIQHLMSLPENKGAVFQVASTPFGGLEGGIAKSGSKVSSMTRNAVQGEWCAIATAGATIFQKYFACPKGPLFLWDDLLGPKDVGYFEPTSDVGYRINIDTAANVKETRENISLVKASVHKNAYVSYGHTCEYAEKNEDKLIQVIDTKCRFVQDVNLVRVSALDIGQLIKAKTPVKTIQNLIPFARTVVKGAYEITAHVAYMLGAKKVFLTLVGAGAYRNQLEWIFNALDTPTFRGLSDWLDIILVYRPEKSKYDKDENPTRCAELDEEFLRSLMPDTENCKDLINQYVHLAYGKKGIPISKEDGYNLSRIACLLNSPTQTLF